jgi:hypothetical protein
MEMIVEIAADGGVQRRRRGAPSVAPLLKMQTVGAIPRERVTLLATSQAISDLHTDRLRAEPSRLLRHPSHFGYFLEWAGAQQPRTANGLTKVEGHRKASTGAAAQPAGGATAQSCRAEPSPAGAVPAVAATTCGLCGIATGKGGVCHQCWFEKWDSVVQLKNLEQKVAARRDSVLPASGAAMGRARATAGAVRPAGASDRGNEKKRRTSSA